MKFLKIQKYKKTLNYSYALGVYPVMELLKNKPDRVLKIILSSKLREYIKSKITKRVDISKIEINDKVVKNLSSKENHYVVGVFEKYYQILNARQNHVVLVKPSNFGNLGTIIRTMLAFGFLDLAIIKPGVDIFAPEVIRSSMGANFGIRLAYFDSFLKYKEKYKNHNYYPFTTNCTVELSKIKLKQPFSLIFGNEGSGLSNDLQKVGQCIKIQQSAKVDSLNLAIAVGIALYNLKTETNNP